MAKIRHTTTSNAEPSATGEIVRKKHQMEREIARTAMTATQWATAAVHLARVKTLE